MPGQLGQDYFESPLKSTYNLQFKKFIRPSKAGKECFPRVIKDLGILDSKTELQTNSLIGIKGDCAMCILTILM